VCKSIVCDKVQRVPQTDHNERADSTFCNLKLSDTKPIKSVVIIFFLDRAEHQLDPCVDSHQTGRRDREVVVPQIHGLHDETSRELCHSQTKEGGRLRYQV